MSDEENFIARWSRRKLQDSEKSDSEKSGSEKSDSEKSDSQESKSQESKSQGSKSQESKSQGSEQAKPADTRHDEPQRAAQQGPPARAEGSRQDAPAFDPATLPPLDSITAETDIRAFLAPGVPAELTRAALRRAWSADPNIRDFVGLAENAWDFTAPDAIGGFGPLAMTDELKRAVANMVGRSLADPAKPTPVEPAEDERPDTVPAAADASSEPVEASAHGSISGERPVDHSAVHPEENEEDTATHNPAPSSSFDGGIKGLHGRALPK